MIHKLPGKRFFPLALAVLLSMAFLFHGNMAAAQSRAKSLTVQLTVLSDTDKQPVPGAACLLTDYGIFAISDADGSARLEKVPAAKRRSPSRCWVSRIIRPSSAFRKTPS